MYPLQNMIQNGQFGYTSPQPYNPYMNNQQYLYNNTSVFNQQQPNNFVYAPINNGYNYYQQNQRYNYYDPYGINGFNNNAGVYQQFNSPASYQAIINEQIALDKIKQRLVANYFHKTFDEEKYDENIRKQLNPPTESYTIEELRNHAELATVFRIGNYYSNNMGIINPIDMSAYYRARYIQSVHDNFDNHSLAQFLCCDIPRIKKHDWIKENVNISGRNLSTSYNSKAYNELLDLHRSSNPYVTELLSNSRYDNNIDDYEMGMRIVNDKVQRVKQIMESEVPSGVTSDDVRYKRMLWTNSIMQQIADKCGGGGLYNVKDIST